MGLPHPVHNVSCEVAKNPTFSLTVRRPTDVRVVLTQRDASGVSPPECHPAAIFVVTPDPGGLPSAAQRSSSGPAGGQRATRVHELTRANVYAHSGDARAERSIEVDLPQLRPGTYMVLCATFAAGQLGPFELTVYANTTGVAVDQVYPPVWRKPIGGGGASDANAEAIAAAEAQEDD